MHRLAHKIFLLFPLIIVLVTCEDNNHDQHGNIQNSINSQQSRIENIQQEVDFIVRYVDWQDPNTKLNWLGRIQDIGRTKDKELAKSAFRKLIKESTNTYVVDTSARLLWGLDMNELPQVVELVNNRTRYTLQMFKKVSYKVLKGEKLDDEDERCISVKGILRFYDYIGWEFNQPDAPAGSIPKNAIEFIICEVIPKLEEMLAWYDTLDPMKENIDAEKVDSNKFYDKLAMTAACSALQKMTGKDLPDDIRQIRDIAKEWIQWWEEVKDKDLNFPLKTETPKEEEKK